MARRGKGSSLPAGHTNAQHLVVTDLSNGHNWVVVTLFGTVSEYNMLYYRALRAGARLARAADHHDLAAGYDAEAELVRNSVNATLFDAKKGLYDISDTLRGPAAQDANALAVLWGVAPVSQQASILQNLKAALYTANGPLAFSPEAVFPGSMFGNPKTSKPVPVQLVTEVDWFQGQ